MIKIVKDFLKKEKKDRLMFFLVCSTIANVLTAVAKLFFALYIPSFWFFVNAGFSFVLGMCRVLTFKSYNTVKALDDEKEKLKEEYKNYSLNGVMLILLGIVYFFVSSYMYYNGTNTNMHEYITYFVALIAFYSIGSAIYGMVKYKRTEEPIIKGIKITKFASALTSIVLTQVVLLDTFATQYDSTINGYTGMGVSIIVMVLGLYMILGAKKDNKIENATKHYFGKQKEEKA